jgi:murein DD-endopeptidase MepM/ murein hydrolase activator NlpD
MGRGIAAAGVAAFITCVCASAGHAAVSEWADPVAAEERLLGSAEEAAQQKELLTFTRQIGDGGVVTGSLADSMVVAGVPASTSLGALKALENVIDLDRDIHTGDYFYVRHEETFTSAGDRIGVGRVLWLEVTTRAKGTVAIHRFQPKAGGTGETGQFWLANGQAAAPAAFRAPLDVMTLTSGFGLRADPLDHPSSGTMPAVVEVPVAPAVVAAPQEQTPSPQEVRAVNRAYAGFDMGSLGSARDVMGGGSDVDRIMARRRVRAQEAKDREREEAEAAEKAKAAPKVEAKAEPPKMRKLFMHEGLDLLANVGTPIHAAADGVVLNYGPAGGYGNWVRLAHAGKVTTVYGHLSRFAPGLQVGAPVLRGELIGFVGNTGRSTGAHLHYEIQANGRPVDPATYPATRRAQLTGADLAMFRKQTAASLAECTLEGR